MSIEQIDDWSSAHFEQSVVAAHQGSFAALGQLLEHYRPYLQRIASGELASNLAGKVAPSDIVQETFLQATHAFRQFNGRTDGEIRAWLRRILLNNIGDAQRLFQAQKRAVTAEVPLVQGGSSVTNELECSAPRPSAIAITAERRMAVEAALQRLPADHRRVIELRSFENLQFEQVGHEMGRSAEAARQLWSRAIQRLALELDP